MENKMIYKPLPHYTVDKIRHIINIGAIEDIIILPLAVGMHEKNWKHAQDICVELSMHEDERVRANSALGFAYIARTKGTLEKHIVKPILLILLHEWGLILI